MYGRGIFGTRTERWVPPPVVGVGESKGGGGASLSHPTLQLREAFVRASIHRKSLQFPDWASPTITNS